MTNTNDIPEWVLVTFEVIEVLDSLAVPYVICGSLASIVHGTPRTTLDADIVADLRYEHIDQFAKCLEKDFYVEPESIRQAITRKSSFNLIHQNTMFKVDIFIPKGRIFDQAQLAHRVEKIVSRNPDRKAWILSPEDIILAKLDWYRLGGKVSERQWRDILGVIKTQKDTLDLEYMQRMSANLGVADLLEDALIASQS